MAVQAQHLAHAFLHDSLAISRPAALDNASAFLGDNYGEPAGGHRPLSELTCNNNNLHDSVCFEPRKRARLTGNVSSLTMESHRALLPVPMPQPFVAPPEDAWSSRVLCSVDASTSSHGVLSHLHRHSVDALVRAHNERLRSALHEARQRHARALASAVERRLRAAEADLERALSRGAELGDRLRQVCAEGQAWRGVATGHEAAAAGLRATLEQLLLRAPPRDEAEGQGDAEDARSCCFGQGREEGAGKRRACRSCGAADACVLLLPCRHLCLCAGCDVEVCPVCAATKNASLHVLLS